MKARWTTADMPTLTGKTAIVTGASSGIGSELARQLAMHGAHVILAARNYERTAYVARQIAAAAPGMCLDVQLLDLGDLASVRRFADEFSTHHEGLDILLNNAGVAGGPRRQTVDGFEVHFQVNYLAHFALTGLLFPLLRAGSRVVSISSEIATRGRIDFDDLQGQRRYNWIAAYAQSKLATLLFAFELDRRSRAVNAGVTSLAAHPGAARTNLLRGKDADWGRPRRGTEHLVRLLQMMLAQPAAKSALPGLYQATDYSAQSAIYVGTSGMLQGGYPATCKAPSAACDQATATRLWEVAEDLTGIRYLGH